MYRYLIIGLLPVFVFNVAFAQNEHKISYDLKQAIERNSENELKVGISFKDNVDFDYLKHVFTNQNIQGKERSIYVIKALQQVSKAAQEQTLDYLTRTIPRDKIHSFWIVNRIIAELNPDQIMSIAEFKDVEQIEWERTSFMPLRPVPGTPSSVERSPGGVEPGLIAINAPAMWELGYTGRGTLLYNYDTGVWEDHPAFSSRYMGKRFPDKQSWYGYLRDYINGLRGDHGTHVLGTMAGMVEETQDTIGVAFKAYWIANDLVGSLNTPVEAHVAAFEWAMNPDGDINTFYDVPDVINNSWGRPDYGTTDHCDSWISDLLNAIEAAGIANVFSGGNDGPDNTEVGFLQSINTSVVNTFCVGSVDANQPAPYPLSDFSSRGPTQCPGEGSQKIHPQVVAPGQNVRSAWGVDTYNSISGTSMAAPHVSGAVLLLKEAFPYLSGEELLWALYHSAIDYGAPGEDNTFGNGLIDVKAAFDLLSLTHVPVDPKNINYDMAVSPSDEFNENSIICDNVFEGNIIIQNLGVKQPGSIEITYWFSGYADTLRQILPGDASSFNTGPLNLESYGDHELNFELSYDNAENMEYDLYNNRCKIRFYRSEPKITPFFEGFEEGINDSIWFVENPDYNIGWDTFPVAGQENSHYAATLQFYQYTPRAAQKDRLLLNNILLDGDAPVSLTYDYAYHPFFGSSTIRDTFRIFVLNECDRDAPMLLKETAGDALYVSDSIFINFKPKYPGHWKQDTVDLSAYQNQVVSIIFEGTNMKWNNLYIDNISVGNTTTKTPTVKPGKELITLYPNPASQSVTVVLNGENPAEGSYVKLVDITGKTVLEQRINEKRNLLNLEHLVGGIYFVFYYDNSSRSMQKLLKIN
jgi:bacillopeptidase F